MNQNMKVLAHIVTQGSITPLEAMSEYGIMRLASRISDLKSAGVPIRREFVASKNRYGETVRYARYYLEEGAFAEVAR